MNANELAEIQAFKTEELTMWERNTTATMLRQQSLEIQALHQILGYEGVAVGQDYLDECVADLKKEQEK